MTEEEFKALKATLNQPVETKVSMKVIYFDIILTVAILIAMLSGVVKSNLGFMVALAVALVVNFPNPKDQTKKVKEFGGTALNMIMIIFSIGVLVGVLKDSGMMDGMVALILAIFPESLSSLLSPGCIMSALSEFRLSMFALVPETRIWTWQLPRLHGKTLLPHFGSTRPPSSFS